MAYQWFYTDSSGSKNRTAKLNEAKVRAIRKSKLSRSQLAAVARD